MRLTWSDLLVDDVTPQEFEQWIGHWRGVVSGRVAVACLNKFGAWFLRRPEGPVDMLDVLTGEVERVADSYEAFMNLVNERAWQETYLASEAVFAFHQAGKVAGRDEAYAVIPHPAFGGPNPMAGDGVAPEQVSVISMSVWQSLCAQSLGVQPQEPR